MNVLYSDIEKEIVDHLSPVLSSIGVEVVRLPQIEAEFKKPFENGRITVAYKGSGFGDVKSTNHIVQDEKAQFELILTCRKLREVDGVYALIEAIKRRVLGFKPTDCSKLYLIKDTYSDRDPADALWVYSVIFETVYRLVENAEEETGPTLNQLTFIYNDVDEMPVEDDDTPDFVQLSNTDGSWVEEALNGLPFQVPDTAVTVTDQNDNELGTGMVPSVFGGAIQVTLPPPPTEVDAEVVDTSGNVIAAGTVSAASPQIEVPDAPVTVTDQFGTSLGSGTVLSGTGGNVQVNVSGYPISLPSGTYVPKNVISGPFDILWSQQSNTVTGNGFVSKTSGAGGWNGSACVLLNHKGDFALNFKFDFVGSDAMFGLDYFKASNDYVQLDFCMYKASDNTCYVYQNGVNVHSLGAVDVNDIFTIERSGFSIMYKKNGVLQHSSAIINDGPLSIDCSILGLVTIDNIEIVIT